MLNIYLARHGQDKDNADSILNGRRRDTPLTQEGIKQAARLAGKIKKLGIRFDKIYCSPLQRTYKTAEIVAKKIGYGKPQRLTSLIEREFGMMTGKPISKVEEYCSPKIFKTATITYFLSPEGAETFPQLIKRARKTLKYLNHKHREGNILLVTHGDIGKMLYCTYYNLGWKKTLQMFHFGNSDLLLMSPKSKPEDSHVTQKTG